MESADSVARIASIQRSEAICARRWRRLLLRCGAPPLRSAGAARSGLSWRAFLAGSGRSDPGFPRCAALCLARRAAARRPLAELRPDPLHRQAGGASFLLRYRWPCGGNIHLSCAMMGAMGESQRVAIDEAIAAALSGATLSGGEFIGTLTRDAVRYLADKLGHQGEKFKT